MRLSFTKLALYEFCPYAYRFRYVERIPIPFSPRLTVGAIVHSVLHRAFERLRDGVRLTRVDLHALHADYWRNAPRLNRERFPDIWDRGHELLDGFWSARGHAPGRPVMLERRFRLRLRPHDAYTVEGVIDRVDERSDGLEIIDYKSGSRPPELPGRLRTQLHTYALALERGFDSAVSRLTVYYLTDNQGISQSPDPAVADDVLKRYRVLAERVGASDFDPTPGRHCRYCDYNDRCAYRWTDDADERRETAVST